MIGRISTRKYLVAYVVGFSNHAKIKMVSKNDNEKVTTDIYNLFSSNSIPCTKQRPRMNAA